MTGTQALDRGLDILFRLARNDGSLSVDSIAEQVGIPTSSAYRLIRALELRGLVQRHGRGRVGLGLAVFDLARAARKQTHTDLFAVAAALMQDLTARTGETSSLTMVSGLQAVCVETVESPRPLRLSLEKGRIFPLYGGASVVVLLAHLDSKTIERVLVEAEGKQYAHGGTISRAELQAKLEQIRREGHAITAGEVDPGATGIAVPILGERGNLLAGLALSAPTDRVTANNLPVLIEELKKTARAITDRMASVAT